MTTTGGRERAKTKPFDRGAGINTDAAWWHVMGYDAGPPRSLQLVEQQFRRLVASAHPDRGGDAEQMRLLIRARAQARIHLKP